MPKRKFNDGDFTDTTVKNTRACPRCRQKRTATNWIFWRMGWRFVRGEWFCGKCRDELAASRPTENWRAV